MKTWRQGLAIMVALAMVWTSAPVSRAAELPGAQNSAATAPRIVETVQSVTGGETDLAEPDETAPAAMQKPEPAENTGNPEETAQTGDETAEPKGGEDAPVSDAEDPVDDVEEPVEQEGSLTVQTEDDLPELVGNGDKPVIVKKADADFGTYTTLALARTAILTDAYGTADPQDSALSDSISAYTISFADNEGISFSEDDLDYAPEINGSRSPLWQYVELDITSTALTAINDATIEVKQISGGNTCGIIIAEDAELTVRATPDPADQIRHTINSDVPITGAGSLVFTSMDDDPSILTVSASIGTADDRLESVTLQGAMTVDGSSGAEVVADKIVVANREVGGQCVAPTVTANLTAEHELEVWTGAELKDVESKKKTTIRPLVYGSEQPQTQTAAAWDNRILLNGEMTLGETTSFLQGHETKPENDAYVASGAACPAVLAFKSTDARLNLAGAISFADYSGKPVTAAGQPLLYLDKQPEEQQFAENEFIGSVAAGTTIAGVPATAANLTTLIGCDYADQIAEDAGLKLDGTNLMISGRAKSVMVSFGTVQAYFPTLEDAIAGLDSVAGKADGDYTFTLGYDERLTADRTLPLYVTRAFFEGRETVTTLEEYPGKTVRDRRMVILDLNKKTLTANELYFNATVIPHSSEAGDATAQAKLCATGTTGSVCFDTIRRDAWEQEDVIRLTDFTGIVYGTLPDKNGQGGTVAWSNVQTSYVQRFLDNTNISAVTVGFHNAPEGVTVPGFENLDWTISESINASTSVTFGGGSHMLDGAQVKTASVTATDLAMENGAVIEAGSITVSDMLYLGDEEMSESGHNCLTATGKLTLNDITTWQTGNTFTVADRDKLILNGAVTTDYPVMSVKCNADGKYTNGSTAGTGEQFDVSSNAIRVVIGDGSGYDAIADGVLFTAKQVTDARAFVAFKKGEDDDHDIYWPLKKSGNDLVLCTGIPGGIILQSTAIDPELNTPVADEGFDTLAEALAAITTRKVNDAEYTVLVQSNANATPKNRNNAYDALKFPTACASLKILGASEGQATQLDYSGNLDIKGGTVVLDNIILAPSAVRSTIVLGKGTLTLTDVTISGTNGGKLTGITGAGVGSTATLEISCSEYTQQSPSERFVVNGPVNGIGSVILNKACLQAFDKINIGSLTMRDADSVLAGTATVNKNAKTQTTNITIEGNKDALTPIGSASTAKIELWYNDGTTAVPDWKQLDFDAIEELGLDVSRTGKGIQLVKSGAAACSAVDFDSNNDPDAIHAHIIKKNGVLTYYNFDGGVYEVQYAYIDEIGTFLNATVQCLTWADAVKAIEAVGVAQDYTIALPVNTPDTAETLTMPKVSAVTSLTLKPEDGYAGALMRYYYTGAVKLTSNLTLDRLCMSPCERSGRNYVVSSKSQKWTLSGYDLTLTEGVGFDAPLDIDGGRTGALCIENGPVVMNCAALGEDLEKGYSVFSGTLKNLRQITIPAGQRFMLRGYLNNGRKVQPVLGVTRLGLNASEFMMEYMEGDITTARPTATITELYANNGATLSVDGKLTVTDLVLPADTKPEAQVTLIQASDAFTVSGSVTSSTDNAVLQTTQATVRNTTTTNLTIGGEVRLADPDQHRVAVWMTEWNEQTGKWTPSALTAEGLPLVMAKKASAEAFRHAKDVYEDDDKRVMSVASFDPANIGGSDEALCKRGDLVVVYIASDIRMAVYATTEDVNADTQVVLTGTEQHREFNFTDDAGYDIVGYAPTMQGAMDLITAKKDGSQHYAVVLLSDMTGAETWKYPAKGMAASIELVGTTKQENSSYADEGKDYRILKFTGAPAITCDVTYRDLMLETDGLGDLNAGSNHLKLVNCRERIDDNGNSTDTFIRDLKADKGGRISLVHCYCLQNKGGLDTIEQYALCVQGSVRMAAGSLDVLGWTWVNGDVSVQDLTIGDPVILVNGKADKLIVNGVNCKVTGRTALSNGAVLFKSGGKLELKDIRNGVNGTRPNQIRYAAAPATPADAAITGEVTDENGAVNALAIVIGQQNGTDRFPEEVHQVTDVKALKGKQILKAPKLQTGDFDLYCTEHDQSNNITLSLEQDKFINPLADNAQEPLYRLLNTNLTSATVRTDGLVFKANNEIYYLAKADEENGFDPAGVLPTIATLKKNGGAAGICLDYAQALAQIDNYGAGEAYEITVGYGEPVNIGSNENPEWIYPVPDLNVTDNQVPSALTLPKKDKASALTVRPATMPAGQWTVVRFKGGNTTAYGNLTLDHLVLAPEGTQNFTLSAETAVPAPLFTFAHTGIDTANGCVDKITGSKTGSVRSYYSETDKVNALCLKTGFDKLDTLSIDGGTVVTGGKTDIGMLRYGGAHEENANQWEKWEYAALGKTTVSTILIDKTAEAGGGGSGFIPGNVRLTTMSADAQAFTLTGEVLQKKDGVDGPVISPMGGMNGGTGTIYEVLPVQVAVNDQAWDQPLAYIHGTVNGSTSGAKYTDGVRLLIAPKTSASVFRAAVFVEKADNYLNDNAEGIGNIYNLAAYKDAGGGIYNGRKSDMAVRVTREAGVNSRGTAFGSMDTYTKSWAEAVKVVEAAAEPDASYTFALQGANAGYFVTGAVKNGHATVGKFTLPAKGKNAKQVTVTTGYDDMYYEMRGDNAEKGSTTAAIFFSGALAPTCDVIFKDVVLYEVKNASFKLDIDLTQEGKVGEDQVVRARKAAEGLVKTEGISLTAGANAVVFDSKAMTIAPTPASNWIGTLINDPVLQDTVTKEHTLFFYGLTQSKGGSVTITDAHAVLSKGNLSLQELTLINHPAEESVVLPMSPAGQGYTAINETAFYVLNGTVDVRKVTVYGAVAIDNRCRGNNGAKTMKIGDVLRAEGTLPAEGSGFVINGSTLPPRPLISRTHLTLDYSFSKAARDKAATQLTLDGRILPDSTVNDTTREVESIRPLVYLRPWLWDGDTQAGAPVRYDALQESDVVTTDANEATFDTAGEELPSGYKKLAVMAKGASGAVNVLHRYENDPYYPYDAVDTSTAMHFYKYDKGLYLTREEPVLTVVSTAPVASNAGYQSDFSSWQMAVNELNAIGESTMGYTMILKRDIGDPTVEGGVTLKSLDFPAKAGAITLRGDTSNPENQVSIFFTGNKLTSATDVRITGLNGTNEGKIGIYAVKATRNAEEPYESVPMNISIAKGKSLQMERMGTQWLQAGTGPYKLTRTLGTVSATGAADGSAFSYWPLATEDLTVESVSRVGTVNLYNYVDATSDGDHDGSIKARTRDGSGNPEDGDTTYTVTKSLTDVGRLELGTEATLDVKQGNTSIRDLMMADNDGVNNRPVHFIQEKGNLTVSQSAVIKGTVNNRLDERHNQAMPGELQALTFLEVRDGTLTFTDPDVQYARLEANDIEFKGTAALEQVQLFADESSQAGKGKVTIANAVVGDNIQVIAKQGNTGASQFTVTGTVNYREPADNTDDFVGRPVFRVALLDKGSGKTVRTNDGTGYTFARYAALTDGFVLGTAKLADASFFTPWLVENASYDTDDTYMGPADAWRKVPTDNTTPVVWTLMKNVGSLVWKKPADAAKVRLVTAMALDEQGDLVIDPTTQEPVVAESTYFATWADAVKEIDARGDMKADYTMVLLTDDANGAPGGVKVNTLALPAKAHSVTVTGDDPETSQVAEARKLYFTGGIGLKSDLFVDHTVFAPVTAAGKYSAPAVNVGAYSLALDISTVMDRDGTAGSPEFGAVTGKGEFAVYAEDGAGAMDMSGALLEEYRGTVRIKSVTGLKTLAAAGNGASLDITGDCSADVLALAAINEEDTQAIDPVNNLMERMPAATVTLHGKGTFTKLLEEGEGTTRVEVDPGKLITLKGERVTKDETGAALLVPYWETVKSDGEGPALQIAVTGNAGTGTKVVTSTNPGDPGHGYDLLQLVAGGVQRASIISGKDLLIG